MKKKKFKVITLQHELYQTIDEIEAVDASEAMSITKEKREYQDFSSIRDTYKSSYKEYISEEIL